MARNSDLYVWPGGSWIVLMGRGNCVGRASGAQLGARLGLRRTAQLRWY